MTVKHTPGPWKIERVPIQSSGGSNTCWKIGPFQACIYDDHKPRDIDISEGENLANARLIGSAPRMFSVLGHLLSILASDMTVAELEEVRIEIKAVIAEARQESL